MRASPVVSMHMAKEKVVIVGEVVSSFSHDFRPTGLCGQSVGTDSRRGGVCKCQELVLRRRAGSGGFTADFAAVVRFRVYGDAD